MAWTRQINGCSLRLPEADRFSLWQVASGDSRQTKGRMSARACAATDNPFDSTDSPVFTQPNITKGSTVRFLSIGSDLQDHPNLENRKKARLLALLLLGESETVKPLFDRHAAGLPPI
ncbi:hypothetical protein ACFZC5_34830 [Nocardia gamkensis]|uniref:hypothetical protein n=1 Tax=Nocardia gamkensis TaxID=352869 RepID=UPI0036E1728A